MKHRIHITLLAIAVVTIFGVYAADEPITLIAQASAASDEVSADDAKRATFSRKNGYRRVVKNGEELFCRREEVTGSRTNHKVSCLTQAQLDSQIQGARDNIERIRNAPVETMSGDSSGGRVMGPMSQ